MAKYISENPDKTRQLIQKATSEGKKLDDAIIYAVGIIANLLKD
jgi:hypothetical protein